MIDLALVLQLFVLINPFSTFPFLLDARATSALVLAVLVSPRSP